MVNYSMVLYKTLAEAESALEAISNTVDASICQVEEGGMRKYAVVTGGSRVITLEAGDLQIGAAEIKDSSSDTRATVGSQGLQVETRSGYTTKTATIAESGSLSSEVDLEGYIIAQISMPAAWTAASLTFQVATTTGGTFQDLYDDSGNEVTSSASASKVYAQDINITKLAGARFLKIRSGTSASAVAQAAERTITLILKG
jgi:hypothetical protein